MNDPHDNWLRVGDGAEMDEPEDPTEDWVEQLQRDYEELQECFMESLNRERNLKNEYELYKSRAEQWRRQLGAATQREHRHKARIRELEAENAKLLALGADYRAKYEESTEEARRAFNAMTGNAEEQLEDLLEGRSK